MHSTIISTWEQWEKHINGEKCFGNVVVQDLDFTQRQVDWSNISFMNTSFLGCTFPKSEGVEIIERGAFVYPKFKNLPYNPYRQSLYTYNELLEGYSPEKDDSTDLHIYRHFVENKYNPPVHEAMAQRIHDHNIDTALRNILGYNDQGMTERKAVGFMGGHSTRRGSKYYNKVALAAKKVAEKGFYVATGGGPGVMEAANLGAYFLGYSDADLMDAIAILSDLDFAQVSDPDYKAKNYITRSREVLEKYPSTTDSLAIPTWFYGHEPSNLFATHIAKYFSNSIREDTLLAICIYGVVYAPGSAGTTQEIFQEAAQNHYGTFGYYSPMVFLGKERYVEDTSLYSVIHQLAKGKKYKELLHLTDSPQVVADYLEEHPPIVCEKA